MRRIRYLSILALLFCTLASFGQNDFNPANPDEPGQPNIPKRLVLLSNPSHGGSTNGSGKHKPGEKINIRAYNNSGFVFVHWTDTKGKEISKESSFYYIQPEKHDTLIAHYRFSPGSPAEPKEPALTQHFHLSIGQVAGGSGYGGGSYLSGNSINISCNVESGYTFCGWYNQDNELVSDKPNFKYVTTAKNETLTPCFNFNPGNPDEPPVPVLSHNIKLEATEGGTVHAYHYRLKEGSSTTIDASANTGYRFVQWLKDGEPYTKLEKFTYTMENKDVTFKAEFLFDPSNPGEPVTPTDKQYTFYLMSKIAKPGTTIEYPIYMTTLDTVCDMQFHLTFPDSLRPDLNSVLVSEKLKDYKVSYSAVSDTVYAFSLIGSQMLPTNTLMLKFNVPIPREIGTGISRQVKINQVSLTKTDGTHVTASTRNGRIYVFKNGDTNGDDAVDVLDKKYMVLKILQQTPEDFIEEVSDVNDDSTKDVLDCKGIVDIIIKVEK